MAWRFVQQPNGLLARFSEVVDTFTHYDFTWAEAVDYCQREYHMPRGDAITKVQNALDEGAARYYDALGIIRRVHGDAEAEEMILILTGQKEPI